MKKNTIYRYYYILATIAFFTMALGTVYKVQRSFHKATKVDDKWIQRQALYDQVNSLIAKSAVPPNAIFGGEDVYRQEVNFSKVSRELFNDLDLVAVDIEENFKNDPTLKESWMILRDKVRIAQQAGLKVFRLYKEKDFQKSGVAMAKMDQSISDALLQLVVMRGDFRKLRKMNIDQEIEKTNDLLVEFVLVGSATLGLVIFAFLYGKKLREEFEKNQVIIRKQDLEIKNILSAFDQHSIVLRTSFDGRIKYANDKAQQILGKTLEKQQDIFSYLSATHSIDFVRNIKESIVSGKVWHGLIQFKNENIVWLDSTIYPVFDEGEAKELIFVQTDVSEQKSISNEIEKQSLQKELLFDNMLEGLVVQDSTGKIIEFNPSALRILSLSEDQILGKSSYDPIWNSVDEKGKVLDGYEHPAMVALRNQRPVRNFIMGINPPNKETTWIKINSTPIFFDGEIKVISTFSDISNEIKQQQSLEEGKTYLDLALDGAGLGIWDWNLVDNSVVFDRRWTEMLGLDYEKTEMKLETWKERVHPDDIEQVYVAIKEYMDGNGDHYESIHRMKHADGRWIYILDKGRISKWDESGKPIRFTGTHLDVTEFEKTKEKLSLLFDKATVGFIFVDINGLHLDVNQEYCQMTGLSHEECLGEPLKKLVLPQYHAVIDENFKQITSNNRFGPIRVEFDRKDDGALPVEISGFLVKSLDGTESIWGIVEDISERLAMEKSITRARDEAILAEKAKSEFLANMSHEIRTPMNDVLGMVQLLSETDLTEEQTDMVETIAASGDGLMTVLNDILDLSKIESGKFELDIVNFDLISCIEQAIFLLSYSASDKGIDLFMDSFPESELWVQGDVTRIRQILVNFISNAVKFTGAGEVKVSLQAKQFEHDIQLCIEVIDTGIGIPKDSQAKLFKAFSQADTSTTRKFGGTGLGLSICAKLATLMNGDISFDSEEGVGSTFRFRLKLKKGDKNFNLLSAKKPVAVVNNTGVSQGKNHILVVEDNKINQKIAKMMLQKIGYTCEIANNGVECLKLLEKNSYSLILMDLQMPEMDGITATKQIQLRYGESAPPIVAMTANAFSDDKERCREIGMVDFLPKPVNLENLKAVLGNYLSNDKKAS